MAVEGITMIVDRRALQEGDDFEGWPLMTFTASVVWVDDAPSDGASKNCAETGEGEG